MHFFAKIKNNIVENVLVAEQDFIDTLPKEEGVIYVETFMYLYGGKLHDEYHNEIGTCSQMNSATVGGTYLADKDIFVPPKNYPSHVLNTEDYDWDAPIPYPEDGEEYYWDESVYNSDNSKGWVLAEE